MSFNRKNVCALFVALCFFAACGESSSGTGPDPVAKISSSSEVGIVSSSSITDKGSSSRDESMLSSSTDCSSSAKSSSSDVKSFSSVTSSSSGTSAGSSAGNSSSSEIDDLSCAPEEEGQILEFTLTGKKYICKNGSLIEIESSSSEWSSSSYFDMSNQFNPDVEYGEFTDPRDGQKYRTISMYDDVFERTYVFFVENLNFGKMITGGAEQSDSSKYCYDDDLWYCENGWGGLYTWSNAMSFPAICDSVSIGTELCSREFVLPSGYIQPQNYVQHQGICPEGWHVVNGGEWAFLQEKNNVYAMNSKVASFGNNGSGLSILPVGYWQRNTFEYIVDAVGYYLPQQYEDQDDVALATYIHRNDFRRGGGALKTNALSIRCVKNY